MIDQLLKLQRQACTAAALIAGGSGCRNQLKDVDNLLRRIMALGQAGGGGGAGGAGAAAADEAAANQIVVAMQRQPINKAYVISCRASSASSCVRMLTSNGRRMLP